MTAWRVRPFADADHTAYARIASIAEGRPLDPAGSRAEDAQLDADAYVRLVVPDEEDAAVGYGEIRHRPSRREPHRYRMRLGVDTRYRQRGIGAALWNALAAELAGRSAEVVDVWSGDHTACQAFITKRGFTEVSRMYQQVRAVASAPLPTRAIAERVTGTGIQITNLAALIGALGDPALEAAWALHVACLPEGGLGQATPEPFDDWVERHVTGALALPDAYFVALDGARYIGVSCVLREGADALRSGITGVLPAYRRRGIGRLLKLRVHAWARANGFSEIHTTTSRENIALLALNDDLGYPIVASWGGYELRLRH